MGTVWLIASGCKVTRQVLARYVVVRLTDAGALVNASTWKPFWMDGIAKKLGRAEADGVPAPTLTPGSESLST
jgi:hypothetical protein